MTTPWAAHLGTSRCSTRARLLTATLAIVVSGFVGLAHPSVALGQCPEAPPLQNYTGGGSVVCPCFIPGEQAGAVFTAPAGDYPLEILRVGIGWGSQFGVNPQQLEQAIHIYAAGLPDPGAPIFTLPGPQLTDGVINQFDLEPLPGEIVADSGSFTVTLEFLNQSSGNPFASSVVHDSSGCHVGRNAVYALPGGWSDACLLGVTGDWVFYVVYRPCVPTNGVGDPRLMVSSAPAFLMPPRPNPFSQATEFDFVLAESGPAALVIYDVSGRRIARLAGGVFSAGAHRASWDGRADDGARAPSGVYFAELSAGDHRSTRRVLIED